MSLPVSRPAGRALIVGSAGCRARPLGVLKDLGFDCAEAEDPYAAVAELGKRPLAYRAMILSLQSLYKEELSLIATARRRFPHLEVWLTDTDGRQGALAEAMRLGAEGLLGEDGLHRIAVANGNGAATPPPHGGVPLPAQRPSSAAIGIADRVAETPAPAAPKHESRVPPAPRRPIRDPVDGGADGASLGEPVLTAEELRALLQEQPSPSGNPD